MSIDYSSWRLTKDLTSVAPLRRAHPWRRESVKTVGLMRRFRAPKALPSVRPSAAMSLWNAYGVSSTGRVLGNSHPLQNGRFSGRLIQRLGGRVNGTFR